MTYFKELLERQSTDPVEQQKHLSLYLAEVLGRSRMTLWNLGDKIVPLNRRALIGVAPYSIYDLELLDALNEVTLDAYSDRIDVFDVFKFRDMKDFEQYIPGIENVFQTPILGLWINGELRERLWGHSARERILQLYL